jgi:NADH:ubiquinone oxidoreductase subunit F (NADH-binding)
VVLDDSRCLVDAVRLMSEFFRDESCGKCFPCRIGTQRTVERIDRLAAGTAQPDDAAELAELDTLMVSSSACGLGVAAPGVVRGLLQHFAGEVDAHRAGECPAGTCGVAGG